jgi:arylsulfatase A-like enzyme
MSRRATALLIAAFAALLVADTGCRGREDLDGRRRALPGLKPRAPEHRIKLGKRRAVLDLFDNRAAALVHLNGVLTIDCGTADFAKYAEGGYRSPWMLGAEDGKDRVARVGGVRGSIYVPLDTDPAGVSRDAEGGVTIYLRVRPSAKRQLASVLFNGHRLGDISMPTTGWRTYSIRAPASVLRPGENKLRLYFRHAVDVDGHKSAAALARISIGSAPPRLKELKVGQTVHRSGGTVRALRAPGPARFSYYLAIPRDAPRLLFSYAGKGGTKMSVQIASAGGGAATTVWKGDPGKGWQDARVDLVDYAGRIVRVDLVTTGPADWGRPLVTAAPVSERSLSDRVIADHVIVWVVSALRNDRLAGSSVPTPGFARFLEHSTRFTSATTNSPAPAPAHVALLTGRRPERGSIAKGAKTLGERFRAAGYASALISGNGFVNDDRGFAQGFDLYRNPMRRRHPFGARILWQKARRMLAKHKNGHALLYIVTVEPHLPYTPTPESLAAEWTGSQKLPPAETAVISEAVRSGSRKVTPEERSFIEALYNAEVRDADFAFAEMLADLDKLGIADRTAVILVSDHGEEMWERGNFGHGTHMFQEVLNIALAIAMPGQTQARKIDVPVELVDVYATALDLAGIAPNPESQGTSLVPLMRGQKRTHPRPILVHLPRRSRALRMGRYKLVVPLRGSHRLYDLETDPSEQHDIMGKRPIVDRYLRNLFGIAVAYRRAWSEQRWGTPNDMRAAFAADHGL